MATQTMRSFRLKACARCGGDAYLDLRDDPEWRSETRRALVTYVGPMRVADVSLSCGQATRIDGALSAPRAGPRG